MNFYLHRIPLLIKWFYPEVSWSKPDKNKTLYLTFDDGPHPDATRFVLDQLERCQAKAIFFCLGVNIKNHPKIIQSIISNGHTIGNHTYDHADGWRTSKESYIKNVLRCDELIMENSVSVSKLFRPPYGRIKQSQARELKRNFSIILWDYLIGDFDQTLSKEKCLELAKRNVKNGDIVVFHDNTKSLDTLKFCLPKFLKHFSDLGFEFKSL